MLRPMVSRGVHSGGTIPEPKDSLFGGFRTYFCRRRTIGWFIGFVKSTARSTMLPSKSGAESAQFACEGNRAAVSVRRESDHGPPKLCSA